MNKILEIKNLSVCVNDKKILKNVNLSIENGQIHAIMGPNGSGKSTLSYTLMGMPGYKINEGQIFFNGQIINNLSVNLRAKMGLFLAFQNPYEIEGLNIKTFLRAAYNSLYNNTEKELDFDQFEEYLQTKVKQLSINPEFLKRSLNVGFSGGEKKRLEVLQLSVLQPKLIILDEIDSGLDVDALKDVCESIIQIKKDNKDISLIVITHYPRILKYLKPDFVHIMQDGSIINSGDISLAEKIEQEGY
ncbi:Fe-S cluster assembly ATPase SufC [Candidatus Dependentiae bacterium]|nr:Fe-S cluster assembly ATPase SufC [Candidatus Dependentiae bacterium]MBU4387153.1 Fe-S cluster assembly ATPase SufC [Candidatus Dependentiae bacterium]MCG2756738.1 Fe-S cluster assembly ATPase SufC [Candidatus Dependentiae bacterium]